MYFLCKLCRLLVAIFPVHLDFLREDIRRRREHLKTAKTENRALVEISSLFKVISLVNVQKAAIGSPDMRKKYTFLDIECASSDV